MTEQAPRPDVLIDLWCAIARNEATRSDYLEAITALVDGLTATLPDEPRQSIMSRLERLTQQIGFSTSWLVEQRINDAGWIHTMGGDWQPKEPE